MCFNVFFVTTIIIIVLFRFKYRYRTKLLVKMYTSQKESEINITKLTYTDLSITVA